MHLCGPQIDRVGLCWAVQRRDEMATSSCLRRMKWRYHSTKSTKLFLCSFHVLLPLPPHMFLQQPLFLNLLIVN